MLPGPGLVVVALGMALLALEYEWARSALALMGRLLSKVRDAARCSPREGSPRRRLLGVVTAAGFVVATTVLTAGVTTFVGPTRSSDPDASAGRTKPPHPGGVRHDPPARVRTWW